MEELLKKMAKQLDSLDEASLMSLRDKYIRIVDNFEPTERWQEAVLILSFIQSMMWKNQLFNYHWSARTKLQGKNGDLAPIFSLDLPELENRNKKSAIEIKFKLEDDK